MTLLTKSGGWSSTTRKSDLLSLLMLRSFLSVSQRPICCAGLQIHQNIEELWSSISCRATDTAAQSALLLPLPAGSPCSTIPDSSSLALSTGQTPAELRCESFFCCLGFVLCSTLFLWLKMVSYCLQVYRKDVHCSTCVTCNFIKKLVSQK